MNPYSADAHPARNHGLDTLRALAIVLVFMNHYMLFVSESSSFGFFGEIGWSGVDLFFALSGYLIGNQIFAAQRSAQGFSLPRFYARRLLRTLPNFYVVLALYACWPYFRNGLSLPPLWKFLTFTQNIHLTPGTAFSYAWSLCVEEQFYLLLPALALAIAACGRWWPRRLPVSVSVSLPGSWQQGRSSSLPLAWLVLVAGIAGGMLVRHSLWTAHVAGSQHPGYQYYPLIYYASLCRADELLAGVALALLKNFHAPLWTRLTSYRHSMLAAGAALLALAWAWFLDDHFGWAVTVFGYPLLALACALLILAALSPGALLYRTRVPGAASIALWSYAIYLTHKQICVLLAAWLAPRGLAPDTWTAIALCAVASVALGWLLFALVETPGMWLRQRWVPAVR